MNAYLIIAYIREKYETTYSHSGMVVWLHQHAFSYKEPAKIPAKYDTEKHETFIKHYAELKASLPEDAVILFSDGVHHAMKIKI